MDEYERSTNDAKAEAGRREAARRLVIQSLAKHRDGRDFLWWLLEQGNTFGVAYALGGDGRHDPGASAFLAGKQAYGRLVLDEILRSDPEVYLTMTKENRNVRRPRDQDRDSSAGDES